MLIFIILCVALAVIGIAWLFRKAQNRQSHTPDKKLTDALQILKMQGKNSVSRQQEKDKQNGR
ncbi:MAG: hypothetical protein J6A84_03010 [Clostridia bacterium]|nr:hypothetical protein [Clostridia bacterium]